MGAFGKWCVVLDDDAAPDTGEEAAIDKPALRLLEVNLRAQHERAEQQVRERADHVEILVHVAVVQQVVAIAK